MVSDYKKLNKNHIKRIISHKDDIKMKSYIFFNINIDKLDEYSDATIYHSSNNWTIPILFKNCDFYINNEDMQYRFYIINTIEKNTQFKIKNKDIYTLLTDSNFLTFNDNGNINNMIITTEQNNLYNGISHININDNMIKIFKNEWILFEGAIINYNLNGKGIEYYKENIKKYEGEYKDGKRNGTGTLYYSINQKQQYYDYNKKNG